MSSNFWANKLAQRSHPNARIPNPSPTPPPTTGPAWWQESPVAPQQEPPQTEGVYNASATPRQASSLRQNGGCPSCGSGDYFAPDNIPNAVPRCYACGHRQNYVAPTAQPLGAMRNVGDVQATRQIHDGSSHFSWNITEKIG